MTYHINIQYKSILHQYCLLIIIFKRSFLTVLENSLSHGTEETGMHKNVHASSYKCGYWCFCSLKYVHGSSCLARFTSDGLLQWTPLHLSSACSVPQWNPADAKCHL